jgi:hypothetical protein
MEATTKKQLEGTSLLSRSISYREFPAVVRLSPYDAFVTHNVGNRVRITALLSGPHLAPGLLNPMNVI